MTTTPNSVSILHQLSTQKPKCLCPVDSSQVYCFSVKKMYKSVCFDHFLGSISTRSPCMQRKIGSFSSCPTVLLSAQPQELKRDGSENLHFLTICEMSSPGPKRWFVLHKLKIWGNSLEVQWLGLSTSTAGGSGLIPGWGTKILQATQRIKKKKKKIEE